VVKVLAAKGRGGERDRERGERFGWEQKWRGRLVFCRFWTQFSSPGPWKSNLFIGDRKGTLCLFWCQISALGSTRKHPNHWFKVAMMNYQFCVGKWLVGLAILGRCHRLCNLDQPERLTLSCSQVSRNRLRVRFV
jgi:hypothetical protein